ncbi:MAG: hypothetical protein N2Z22_00170 [Turneriella sp.]|nr:hypothetical protein [Leptospiraceae bacterium]MCX7631725.1 hypothetical protein [Turneriella sp.]
MAVIVTQLWNNLVLFFTIGVFLELAISAIFSIRLIDELLSSTLLRSVKNLLVLLAAFGLCAKMEQLRLFFGTKIQLPEFVHYILSSLVLARMANLVHDFWGYLRSRSKNM